MAEALPSSSTPPEKEGGGEEKQEGREDPEGDRAFEVRVPDLTLHTPPV